MKNCDKLRDCERKESILYFTTSNALYSCFLNKGALHWYFIWYLLAFYLFPHGP